MRNIKLIIAYDGTKYAGWQVQKNANTIQAEIEKALKKIFREKVRIAGAGRTDSGAHARGQVANFRIDSGLSLQKIKKALNNNLPEDIVVKKTEAAPLHFNAQFSAKSKSYRYAILNSDARDPFTRKYAFYIPYKLDLETMRRAARMLVGKHDFKSFQAKDAKMAPSIRTIKTIKVEKSSPIINIDIEADGFLYKMVRNIVGTLIEIGRRRLTPSDMKKIFYAKDRRKAGPTVPAKGLTLVKVRY